VTVRPTCADPRCPDAEEFSSRAPTSAASAPRAAAGETIRAEPFEAIEIRVSELLGDDDDDDDDDTPP
jgi:hypothetical protein